MNGGIFKFISSSRVYIYLDYLLIYFQTIIISSPDSSCRVCYFVEYNDEHSEIEWGNLYITLTQDVAHFNFILCLRHLT